MKLADVIPWHVAETMYAKNFMSKRGAPALTVRMALGTLIIKETLGLSDIKTVEQIKENPYLQYFIGLESFQYEAPFDASMLTHFRKRLKHTDLAALQEELLQRHLAEERKRAEDKEENKDGHDDGNDGPANKGKLIVDATCAPADIAYPTDIGLLNDAREKTERIIDKLCEMHPGGVAKPRMSRCTARKDFLAVGMKKSLSRKALRKGLRKQLGYLRRNLQYIGGLSASVPLTVLSKRLYRDLLVIDELYRQQQEMYKSDRKSISDRIVSISQPHVRPIVRGKAAAKTEFGMKLSISVVDGISMPERSRRQVRPGKATIRAGPGDGQAC